MVEGLSRGRRPRRVGDEGVALRGWNPLRSVGSEKDGRWGTRKGAVVPLVGRSGEGS